LPTTLLATKLYIPPPAPTLVQRARLLARLDAGTQRKLTLVSAPAGFGKTTLVSSWIAGAQASAGRRVAWLSLDAGDNDPARFITYLVAALRTVAPDVGAEVLSLLQPAMQTVPSSVLTALLNEVAAIPGDFVLVLDDLHAVDAQAVEDTLAFLVDYLPPQTHLVITSREDPALPLARLRARGELTEIRATELRFTNDEAAAFLNSAMGLALTAEDVAALDARTEGWIAGLQLAAISLQGHPDDAPAFIESFTGSHRFVMDYLVEEVLSQQPEAVQAFLLRTSVLERLCAPLCDAVVGDGATPGQATLETLERANLFVVPLDDERRWYRYHHLFGDLLRQRLRMQAATGGGETNAAELHRRASQWYEENGLALDAFHHATAANDIERADRLLAGKGMPLHFRGAVTPVLAWLASLPPEVLDTRPRLWVMYASALSMTGRLNEVEAKLLGAESALRGREMSADNRNLVGHIAAIRAFLAATKHDAETIIAQSQIALEYLHPDNLPVRTATAWKLGIAYHLRGEREAAAAAYEEAITAAERTGNLIVNVSARAGLGLVQESEMQLRAAEETYGAILAKVGGTFQPAAGEAHLGMARIRYERNDLAAARRHAEQSLRVAEQMQHADNPVLCRVFYTYLALAEGNVDAAAASVAQAEVEMRRQQVMHQAPAVATASVRTLLRQGNVMAAEEVAEHHNLPLCTARVRLAQGDAPAALAVLSRAIVTAEERHWADQRLRGLVLQALALHADGQGDTALDTLERALGLAAPAGCVRLFVDEGAPMAALLAAAERRGMLPVYTRALLDACAAEPGAQTGAEQSAGSTASLVDPLSERELEILSLITQGLKNQEIADQLIISLNTVLYHTKNIYGKLGVNKRALAIARARELQLI